MLGSALDTLMDLTVIPGYTAIGPRVRRRIAGWQRDLPRMDDRVVLVTGATAGIGLAAAHGFASLGAAVILVARDGEKGARVRDELAATTGNDRLRVEVCDVSSPTSVRALAARLAGEPLHVLVHNAGLLPARRNLTGEGLELAFATNVLGPFLLTSLLEAQLVASAPSRVVWVSSGGMYTERIDVEDLQSERIAGDWDGPAVYARTKRAEVILSEQWAERLAGTGVSVHAMHPGWVATAGVAESLPRFNQVMGPLLRTPDEGADTIVWLGAAVAPGQTSGGFWCDRRERPTHRLPRTRETPRERDALWDACVALSGATLRGR